MRVEWSQPSGGAAITGYVIHYSDGDTDRTESVPASSTSSLITGLTDGLNYTFSVEATSEHLSGESNSMVLSPQRPTQFLLGDMNSAPEEDEDQNHEEEKQQGITKYGSGFYIWMDKVLANYACTVEKFDLHL